MNKKILIIGATGAMAVYLIPCLLEKGYEIDGISLDDVVSNHERLKYIKADAMDIQFLETMLKNKYDAIVDFMVYNSVELYSKYYKLFLDNTSHYIFLSTYRVYAGDHPLKETSKRLLDVEKPDDFVSEYEYSIYKAREEDLLRSSPYKNYTIIRPAITYSKRRFQLVTLEADVLIWRMLNNKTIILPNGAMDKQATMTWAGDVAKMISAILFNPQAMCETYTVSTSEHMTWREVAKIYEEIGNLKYKIVDDDVFLNVLFEGNIKCSQQLYYDRCFDRIVDNSKILSLCNMKQEELMKLKDGLKMEFSNLSPDDIFCNYEINERIDNYLNSQNLEE